MCIIIHKPQGATVALSTILRAYQANDDGWGIIARTPQGLVVRRDFGRYADETLLDTFVELQEHELTVHCRIGTCGERSIVNTHPFAVAPDVWMFHNGIIHIDRPEKRYCDSYHVAKALREGIGGEDADIPAVLRHPEYREALADYAGTSKLVFVDRDGITIVNEHLGYWDEGGAWRSNHSADPATAPVTGLPATTGGAALTNSAIGMPFFGRRERRYDNDHFDSNDLDGDRIHRRYNGLYEPLFGNTLEPDEDEDDFDPATARYRNFASDEFADTGAFLAACSALDTEVIADHCAADPELAANAIVTLLQTRQPALNATAAHFPTSLTA